MSHNSPSNLENSPKMPKMLQNEKDIEKTHIENCARAYFDNFPQFKPSLIPLAINLLMGKCNSWVYNSELNILQSVPLKPINDAIEASKRLKLNTRASRHTKLETPTLTNRSILNSIDDEYCCLLDIWYFLTEYDSSKVQ